RTGAAEHHLALTHGDVARRAGLVDAAHGDVALELEEDLVARVDVKVVPRVRPADDLIDELALRKDFLVRDWPTEVALVLLDPPHQMQRRDVRHRQALRRSAILRPTHVTVHPPTLALNLSNPRRGTPADGEIPDALATHRHRTPRALAPSRVKEPLRGEPVAVGAGAHR